VEYPVTDWALEGTVACEVGSPQVAFRRSRTDELRATSTNHRVVTFRYAK
jgi:hypothetical protein